MLVKCQDTHTDLFVWLHLVAQLLLGDFGGMILALESHPLLQLDVGGRLHSRVLARLARETFAVVNRPIFLSLVYHAHWNAACAALAAPTNKKHPTVQTTVPIRDARLRCADLLVGNEGVQMSFLGGRRDLPPHTTRVIFCVARRGSPVALSWQHQGDGVWAQIPLQHSSTCGKTRCILTTACTVHAHRTGAHPVVQKRGPSASCAASGPLGAHSGAAGTADTCPPFVPRYHANAHGTVERKVDSGGQRRPGSEDGGKHLQHIVLGGAAIQRRHGEEARPRGQRGSATKRPHSERRPDAKSGHQASHDQGLNAERRGGREIQAS